MATSTFGSAPAYGPTNPTPAEQAAQPPRRYAAAIGLSPEKEAYYRALHANVWPSVLERLRRAHIQNYSIFLTEVAGLKILVAYFEYTGSDFEADQRAIAADPETQRWWLETDPCQFSLPTMAPTPTGPTWRCSSTRPEPRPKDSIAPTTRLRYCFLSPYSESSREAPLPLTRSVPRPSQQREFSMADPTPNGSPPHEVLPANREQVLELNFVPAWARKPPGESSFFRDRPERPGGQSRDRDRDRDRDRRPGGGGGGRGAPGGAGGGGNRQNNRDARPRQHDPRRSDFAPAYQRPPEPLPLQVRFLPDDRQIAVLVKRIRSSQRAYPLTEIVSLFLGNPEACRIKLETTSASQKLLQCKPCGSVALNRQEMENHLVREHLEEFYDVEERTGEPPSGNFVCVAKCGLSGVLLGPPNHNLYAERVEDVYRAGYSHMSLEEFKRNIQTLHDPAMIEQWKAECQKQTVYRRKGAAPDAAALRRSAAASQFLRDQAESLIKTGLHATLTVAVARRSGNASLMDSLADAWNRECRAPRNLSIAVHGALRGRHLHVFRAGGGTRFITDIPPVPLAPERAIETIRDVLLCLRAHPGFTRAQLLAELRPGAAPDAPEAAAILSPLGWLVERGHIIEFFDGTLAVPLGSS